MAKKDYPPPSLLCQLLTYMPETGKFYWKERDVLMFSHLKNPLAYQTSWNKSNAGKEAFTATEAWGYKHGSVLNIPVKAHIIAFAMTYGRLPKNDIDHINGQRDDNRIVNIREATRSQNIQNQKPRSDGSVVYKGVIWSKEKNKFRSEIQNKRTRYHLGYFETAELAAHAYNEAAKALHREFAFLNIIPDQHYPEFQLPLSILSAAIQR